MYKLQLEKLRINARKALEYKDAKRQLQAINTLKNYKILNLQYDDTITIELDINNSEKEHIYKVAKELIPWRKGPFKINDIFIDAEWRGYKQNIKT